VVAKEDAADAMAVAICHANRLAIEIKMGVAS
jgi:Holliday junction resolvasome RuvABC endonuclease subunit